MKFISRLFTFVFAVAIFTVPIYLYAQFPNPIAAPTIGALIQALLRGVVAIATPFVVLFLMYSGWKFVTAAGNEEKLTKAKETFMYTLLGGVVVLGAYAIALAIEGTVNALGI